MQKIQRVQQVTVSSNLLCRHLVLIYICSTFPVDMLLSYQAALVVSFFISEINVVKFEERLPIFTEKNINP